MQRLAANTTRQPGIASGIGNYCQGTAHVAEDHTGHADQGGESSIGISNSPLPTTYWVSSTTISRRALIPVLRMEGKSIYLTVELCCLSPLSASFLLLSTV